MRVSPDRTVYGCVLAEVLSSGWRWPDLRLGIPLRTPGRQRGPTWRPREMRHRKCIHMTSLGRSVSLFERLRVRPSGELAEDGNPVPRRRRHAVTPCEADQTVQRRPVNRRADEAPRRRCMWCALTRT